MNRTRQERASGRGWGDGRLAIRRAMLKRHGFVFVYAIDRTQYWTDPITKKVFADGQAIQLCESRERANSMPKRSTP